MLYVLQYNIAIIQLHLFVKNLKSILNNFVTYVYFMYLIYFNCCWINGCQLGLNN